MVILEQCLAVGFVLLLLMAQTGCPTPSNVAAPPIQPKEAEAPADVAPQPDVSATEVTAKQSPPEVPPPASEPSGPAEEVTFDDLKINMQPDIVFRPWMLTERAQQLDGKRIRVPGYMYAALDRSEDIDEFILIRNLECKFGPGQQADHLVIVKLNEGLVTSYPGDKIIYVEGVLKIEPFTGTDGNTWSIYNLAGEKVSTSRF